MKKLILMTTLLVAGGSAAFAQDSMDNVYNYNSSGSSYNYGSQMSSEYNKDYRTSYRSGSCCDGNGSHRSSSRRSGHRNNYNY